jgi:Sulfotransferase family
MTSNDDTPKSRWSPHPRPDWVQKVNEEGYCMDIAGVVPLDENSLINSAIQATGLTDFGADDWREPFQVLLKSMNEEAELNLMGRLRTRSELLQLLEARLQIEDTYKKHPEINDQEITRPIIILGQGRGGTSFTLNLLAAHPGNGTLKHWEAMFPCPPPEQATYHSDPRIAKAHTLIDQWNRVTPELKGMHEFGGDIPQDDCHILGINFRAPLWFNSLGQVPAYSEFMAKADWEPAFRYEKRVLKLLQWKNPRERWVLKDPTHVDHVPTILKVFPDACFVMPHRDPIKSQASATDLIGTIQWGRSDHPFKDGSFDYIVDPTHAADRLNRLIDLLERGEVLKERFYHIQYKDLTGKSLEVVRAIYAHFGLPLSEQGLQGMARYLEENPRTARPPHKYDMGDEQSVAKQRKLFVRYQDYFKVPDEA